MPDSHTTEPARIEKIHRRSLTCSESNRTSCFGTSEFSRRASTLLLKLHGPPIYHNMLYKGCPTQSRNQTAASKFRHEKVDTAVSFADLCCSLCTKGDYAKQAASSEPQFHNCGKEHSNPTPTHMAAGRCRGLVRGNNFGSVIQ